MHYVPRFTSYNLLFFTDMLYDASMLNVICVSIFIRKVTTVVCFDSHF